MSSRRAGRAGRRSRAPGTDPFVEALRLRAAAADPHATSWLCAGEARRPSGVLGGRSWQDGDDSAAASAAARSSAAKRAETYTVRGYTTFPDPPERRQPIATTPHPTPHQPTQ